MPVVFRKLSDFFEFAEKIEKAFLIRKIKFPSNFSINIEMDGGCMLELLSFMNAPSHIHVITKIQNNLVLYNVKLENND